MGEKGRGWGLSFRCEESARGVVVCRGKKEGRILLPREGERKGRRAENRVGDSAAGKEGSRGRGDDA